VAARIARGSDPREQRRAMSMKALISAAHAAGYAMAAEDVAECRPVPVETRPSTALVVRDEPTLWSEIVAFFHFDWLRSRLWHGGAAA
jgi:hypothetical protein